MDINQINRFENNKDFETDRVLVVLLLFLLCFRFQHGENFD